jgi:hypothetical protein
VKKLTVWTYWTILFCSGMGMIFLILPASSMERVYVQEKQIVRSQLGEETLQKIERNSSEWFKRIIVDSGVLRSSYALCERQGKDRFDDRGLAALFAHRLDVFWVAVRQMFFRFGQIYFWFPCVAVIFPPLLFDAYQKLQIRKNQSSHFSPLGYYWSSKIMAFLLLGLTLGPMIPHTLPPLILPGWIGLLGVALWFWLAYMPKRS